MTPAANPDKRSAMLLPFTRLSTRRVARRFSNVVPEFERLKSGSRKQEPGTRNRIWNGESRFPNQERADLARLYGAPPNKCLPRMGRESIRPPDVLASTASCAAFGFAGATGWRW